MIIASLRETHPLIYKRILECQVEQGNEPNPNLSLIEGKEGGNFNWGSTREADIWDRVWEKDFDWWYDFWGIKRPTDLKLEIL